VAVAWSKSALITLERPPWPVISHWLWPRLCPQNCPTLDGLRPSSICSFGRQNENQSLWTGDESDPNW